MKSVGETVHLLTPLLAGWIVLEDVLIGSNDDLAIAAIQAFHDHGVSVPDDLAVIGFDDTTEPKAYALKCNLAVPESCGINRASRAKQRKTMT